MREYAIIVLMRIFVIIPGYNEEQYIATVLKKIMMITSSVLYVDDGSQDNSARIARKFLPEENILQHKVNLGKGAALLTGCEYVFNVLQVDGVVFLDADDQHDVTELPNFFQALKEGNDVVLGIRTLGADMPFFRFLGNKIASVIFNMLFHVYVPDIPSGYKALSRRAFELVRWESSGYEVEMEIIIRAVHKGLHMKQIGINTIYHDTDEGMTLLDGMRVAIFLLKSKVFG